MDAPIYMPAAAFEQPAAVPYEPGVDTVALGEMMRIPVAWAIVLKHAPGFKFAVGAPQLKPQLFNMTVASFVAFGVVTEKAVAEIDAELRALPRSAWAQ